MAAAKKMPKGMEIEPSAKKGTRADVAKMKGILKGKSGPRKNPMMYD